MTRISSQYVFSEWGWEDKPSMVIHGFNALTGEAGSQGKFENTCGATEWTLVSVRKEEVTHKHPKQTKHLFISSA